MIGGTVSQLLGLDFGSQQRKLALRRKRQIMRHVQILKHLLRDTAENWRRNLSSLIETDRRVENLGDDYLRVIQRGETGEGGVVLGLGVCASCRIDFLACAGLSSYRVTVERSPARGSYKHDLLHHGTHLGGRVGG